MALGEEDGWESLEESSSDASGRYIVEEIEVAGRADSVMRRLVFLQNQNFVQTESRLVLPSRARGKPKAGAKKGKSKAKTSKKDKPETDDSVLPIDDFEFDHSYLDAHHRCFLVAMLLNPGIALICLLTV